ncbi:MAG TPA: flagellar basal-body rod protein FlgF [Verrucomicrobiae bacterium]|nr:flagellar basal-body rod protein FlgF [Verrucomicrobiae bacterium]
MDNASYVALARQSALQRALDVTANNVANLRTTGFKAEKVQFEEYMQALKSPGMKQAPLSSVLDVGTVTDMSTGPLETTGNSLDFAILGDGFFAVQTDGGMRYTRGGSFRMDESGQLVTQDGKAVLDTGGSPIQLEGASGPVTVNGTGEISSNGAILGQLGVVGFADPQSLVHEGNGLFKSDSVPTAAPVSIIQGMLESSNAQPIVEITRMIDILRNFESAQKMLDAQHDLSRDTVAKLGKV